MSRIKFPGKTFLKCFPANKISVGLYLRICVSLGVVAPLPTMPDCCVSLRDYLSVDHDLLIKSILQVLLKG